MATLERHGQAGGEGYRRLEAARSYMAENGLMPFKTRYEDGRGANVDGHGHSDRRNEEQHRARAAERQRAQQEQRRERGRR